jgi:hypothetical protein
MVGLSAEDGHHEFTISGAVQLAYFYNSDTAANYTVSNWSVERQIIGWVEEAQDLVPNYSEGCELDTDHYSGGSSSLLVLPGVGECNYVLPTGLPNDFNLEFRMRHNGIDNRSGIWLRQWSHDLV